MILETIIERTFNCDLTVIDIGKQFCSRNLHTKRYNEKKKTCLTWLLQTDVAYQFYRLLCSSVLGKISFLSDFLSILFTIV